MKRKKEDSFASAIRSLIGLSLLIGIVIGLALIILVHGSHNISYKIAFLFLLLVLLSNLLARGFLLYTKTFLYPHSDYAQD